DLAAPGVDVEDPLAHQPRPLPLVRAVVEHAGRPQPAGRLGNGVKDTHLQGDPVAPQLERVVHVLDDEFGVVQDLDDNAVGAPAEFDQARLRFYTRRV